MHILRQAAQLTSSNLSFKFPSIMAHTLGIIFSPLDISKDEIRFVRLLPPTSEEIECELIQVNLNSNPRYEALSYEWGPEPKDPFWISVDGKHCKVRKNLSDALRALRLPTQSRLLWIDALCINQEDTTERNHQVGKMGEIYKNARRAVVWLGLERRGNLSLNDGGKAITFLESIKRQPIEGYIRYKLTSQEEQTWLSVVDLFQRTYWTRLWIIQEVVLATKIIIQCGALKITWGVLGRLFAELQRSHMTFRTGEIICSSIPARLDQQRFTRKTNKDGSVLLDLILINEDADCENMRDKVFGLHSLVKGCCKKAVPVDYSKSLIELCDGVLQHDFLAHRCAGYGFFSSTEKLQRILFGATLYPPGESCLPDGLARHQPVVWPQPRDTPELLKFSGRVIRVPHLTQAKFLRSRQSYAVIPSRCVIPSTKGVLSKAVQKIDEIRKRSRTLSNGPKMMIEFEDVDMENGDVVCQIKDCNFLAVFREQPNGVFIDGEKEGPMFELLGTLLDRTWQDIMPTGETIDLCLDVLTLQKLCWLYSDKWEGKVW
ncbi:heterokaryon incompatibility protein-domain-containing protein [Leptodontidium sp. MPI-SDFR-AT-0119]|nr:heterokaryon incompatibility protein-domain-containing protein [Leptodontidium sp. MPI-SDFR-AT-0119]